MFLIESESQLCLPCQNIIINPLLCMSRKNNNTGLNLQCTKKKKFGDYCGIHSKSFKILRIDELLNYKDLKTSKPRKQSIYPEFKKLKLNELKALCKENNLQIFGKKKDIIQQLEYYYELKV